MANLSEIFGWFSIGKTPTAQQFRDTFSSYFHKSEKLPQTAVYGLIDDLNSKANKDDLINLSVGIKGYAPDVQNIAERDAIENPYEGLAVVVIDDKDDEGSSYIHLYNGSTWNRTPFKQKPNNSLVENIKIIQDAEFIFAIVDKVDNVLWAIRWDGNIYLPYIPPLIKDAIEKKISIDDIVHVLDESDNPISSKAVFDALSSLSTAYSFLFEVESMENIHYITDRNGAIIQYINKEGKVKYSKQLLIDIVADDEYLYSIIDTTNKIVFAINKDGSFYNPKGYLVEKVQSDDYLFQLTDNVGRILFCVEKNADTYIPALKFTDSQWKSIDERIESKVQGTVSSDYSKYASAQLPMPRSLGRIDITTDKWNDIVNGVTVTTETEVSFDGLYFKKKAKTKRQGSTSILLNPKNLELSFLNDDDSKFNLKLGDWVSQDSYHVKVHTVDFFHVKNPGAYKLFAQIFDTYSLDDNPLFAIRQSKKIKNRMDTGALGHPDFCFFELYINSNFYAIGALGLKKNRDNYNMEKTNTSHIHFEMAVNCRIGELPMNWASIEIRNPDGFEEAVEPEDGAVKTSILDFYTWAKGIIDGTIVCTMEELNKRLFLQTWIDYEIVKDILGSSDGVNRNAQVCTWDGNKWALLPYDWDTWGGADPLGNRLTEPKGRLHSQALLNKIRSVFPELFNDRYKWLKDNNITSLDNMMLIFRNITKNIGVEAYTKLADRWTEIPSNRANNVDTVNWEYLGKNSYNASYPAWNESTAYVIGDFANYLNESFKCIKANTNKVPVPNPYTLFPQVGGFYESLSRINDWLKKNIELLDNQYK